jgi:glycosyltransferase involved in cell wall biosynthesis
MSEAFLKCLSDNKRKDIYLVHVGPTAKDLPALGRTDVVQRAAKEEAIMNAVMMRSKLSKQVLVLGHRENPAPYLQASDFFMHASTEEGEANVVNEALACGLPCLLPDVAPYRKKVPCSCSLRFLSGDVNDLSNRMRALISDKDLRISMANTARQYIVSTRSPDNIAIYYSKLLERIAKNTI